MYSTCTTKFQKLGLKPDKSAYPGNTKLTPGAFLLLVHIIIINIILYNQNKTFLYSYFLIFQKNYVRKSLKLTPKQLNKNKGANYFVMYCDKKYLYSEVLWNSDWSILCNPTSCKINMVNLLDHWLPNIIIIIIHCKQERIHFQGI